MASSTDKLLLKAPGRRSAEADLSITVIKTPQPRKLLEERVHLAYDSEGIVVHGGETEVSCG